MKRIICCVAFLFGFARISSAADVTSSEFYKSKAVRLVVGNSVGGAQDDWARFVAQYLGKHIPGNPDILVQNMLGAPTAIAANHIYSVLIDGDPVLGSGEGIAVNGGDHHGAHAKHGALFQKIPAADFGLFLSHAILLRN